MDVSQASAPPPTLPTTQGTYQGHAVSAEDVEMAVSTNIVHEDQPNSLDVQRNVQMLINQGPSQEAEQHTSDDLLDEDLITQDLLQDDQDIDGQVLMLGPTEESGKAGSAQG